MKRLILPSAAALALIANTGLAFAQEHERERGGSPGGSRHAPSPGGPGRMQAPHAEGPHRSEPTRRAEPQRGINRERQQETQREQRRGTEQDRARLDRQREQDRNAERDRAAQQRKGVEERQRSGQREQNRNAERDRTAQQRKEVEERQRSGQRGERNERGDRLEEVREARTRLSTQDRERMHRSFDFQRARLTNVNFDHRVGRRVPRNVRLFPISGGVISFFPYYRDYSYFVVDDEICIVDPRTYEIVDIIDEGYWRSRPQVAGLRLSSVQIALVRDSVPRDFPETHIRLRLALSAQIPGDVELYELPQIVLARVPELREYRFLVADEQIVIVDPRDRSIALVIERA